MSTVPPYLEPSKFVPATLYLPPISADNATEASPRNASSAKYACSQGPSLDPQRRCSVPKQNSPLHSCIQTRLDRPNTVGQDRPAPAYVAGGANVRYWHRAHQLNEVSRLPLLTQSGHSGVAAPHPQGEPTVNSRERRVVTDGRAAQWTLWSLLLSPRVLVKFSSGAGLGRRHGSLNVTCRSRGPATRPAAGRPAFPPMPGSPPSRPWPGR